jgi:uncharacterized protein (TIGR00730 family)
MAILSHGQGVWLPISLDHPSRNAQATMTDPTRKHPMRSSKQDVRDARLIPDTPQTRAPTYRLAFADPDFLTREELRPIRLQLEMLKPEMALDAEGIESTIVLFGGARIREGQGALGHYYDEARRFAQMVTMRSMAMGGTHDVIITGGGPGVMEAGNRGAVDAGGRSIGLNIVLPHEQAPNGYVTPSLCFNFHYFAIRKMHFLMRARAVCVFPGGFGTLDEMFESLTLIQTRRMAAIPFVLFGRAFWETVINWQALAEAGVIGADDLRLITFVETAEEALAAIDGWKAT